MLDMINVNNIYVLTQNILYFIRDSDEARDKLQMIADAINTGQKELKIDELLGMYLQFNRVGTLCRLIEVNRPLMARIDIVKMIRMGQIHGFLVRNHQKIGYSSLPCPLVLGEPLKKLMAERDPKLPLSEKF